MRRTLTGVVAVMGTMALAALASPGTAVGSEAAGTSKVVSLDRPPVIASSAHHFTKGFAGVKHAGKQATRVTASNAKPIGQRSVIGADGRTQVLDTSGFPSRAIGQIELTQDGLGYICTGWLIDHNTILSAGHCAYDPSAGPNDIIESATFSPGRNGGTDPNGACNVLQVYSPDGWKVDGLPEQDWSLMQLDCTIGDTVGWLGMMYKTKLHALDGEKARVQGYPGDKPFGTQWLMSGKIAGATKLMLFYGIDTAGGQSGSPVFQPKGAACGGTPCGMGIHNYGVGLPGPGQTKNGSARITKARFNLINDIADDN